MPLIDKLKTGNIRQSRKEPLWQGPGGEGPLGGITFSMLSRFLVCRERFRLYAMEGLRPNDSFNQRIEYGSMWHICEEALAAGDPSLGLKELKLYTTGLCRKYPTQAVEITKWFRVCRVQFPIYVDYWSKQKDVVERTPLLQEAIFDVPYKLPSRRVVRLRGKWDSVDLIGEGKKALIYLQENKTKSDINEAQLKRQLTFDLQTMMYLVALSFINDGTPNLERIYDGHMKIGGVRYNCIRRPLSGGKGTIVQRKGSKNVAAETAEEYYARLGKYISDEPETYFMRWKVEIPPSDVRRFEDQCLSPILEQLCDWWEWVSFITKQGGSVWDNDVSFGARPDLDDNGRHCSAIHWRHPFGCYNILDEGGVSDLDVFLESGSTIGLQNVDTLFTELN